VLPRSLARARNEHERLNYPTLGSSPHQVEPRQARRTEVAVHPDGHFCLYACYQSASSFPEQIHVAPRSVGIATSSAILIVAAYSFFARLAQDYVETLMNDNLCHLSTSRVSAVIVIFMMHYAPFLDRLWIHAQELAQHARDTLFKTGIFIVVLTLMKWVDSH